MSKRASPTPKGFHAVTPGLAIQGASKAIEFYEKALGAKQIYRMLCPRTNLVVHADLVIGDSHVFVSDEFREMGALSPKSLGGSPVGLYLYVTDVDAVVARAVRTGAKLVQAPSDMFWGDRNGCIEDPFGYTWTVSTHMKDLSPQEIEKGMKEYMSAMETAAKKPAAKKAAAKKPAAKKAAPKKAAAKKPVAKKAAAKKPVAKKAPAKKVAAKKPAAKKAPAKKAAKGK